MVANSHGSQIGFGKMGSPAPTLVRAVDSNVMLALRSTGRSERMTQKRAVTMRKEMDLTDLISRLENNSRF